MCAVTAGISKKVQSIPPYPKDKEEIYRQSNFKYAV